MKNEIRAKEPLTVSKLKLIKTLNRNRLFTPVTPSNLLGGNTKKLTSPYSANTNNIFRGLVFQRMDTIEVAEEPTKIQPEITKHTKLGLKKKIPEISEINENITEIRKRDENEVKRLNIWEKDILNQEMFNDPQFQSSKKELECINWKNDIRDSLRKLNLSSNNFYEDLVKSADREQGSILFQNINITKKKFQFELFREDSTNNAMTHMMSTENENDDLMNKYKTLKQDANYDNIIKTDYYREIIKEKIKLEMSYTKELNILAQKIFDLKQKKINISHEMFEIINYLKDLEKDYQVICL
jgi:hypothetical protein